MFVQCFDPQETRRLREELKTRLRLIQLIGENDWNEAPCDFDQMRTPAGIRKIAEYADGIGPNLPHVVARGPQDQPPRATQLVSQAHASGLLVHPYTLRADSLPGYASDFEQLLGLVFTEAQVDGAFTDFPDRVRRFLDTR